MIDLDELERKAKAATPGPWETMGTSPAHDRHWVVDEHNDGVCETWDSCDATYIAAASPDVVLALIAEVRRLREALRELTATVRGECPSLLNEDSGGDGALAVEIDALLGGDA